MEPVATDLTELYETLHKKTGRAGIWTAAVRLKEDGLVALAGTLEDEITFAVIPMPGDTPLEVSIYAEDEEWDCECGSEAFVCQHVLACVIALHHVNTEGGELPDRPELITRYPLRPRPVAPLPEPKPERPTPRATRTTSTTSTASRARKAAAPSARSRPRAPGPVRRPKPVVKVHRDPGPIGYRLERTGCGLTVKRVAVFEDIEIPIKRALDGDDGGGDPPVVTEAADLLVQEVLGKDLEVGLVSGDLCEQLLRALDDVADLTLDGKPMSMSFDASKLVIAIEDHTSDRFRLTLRPEPPVDEHFINGLARRGDTICLIDNSSELLGEEMRRLSMGQTYESTAVQRLVTVILPDLERQLPVLRLTDRLPTLCLSEPRAEVTVERDGDTLTATGVVVYGDPAIAKVIRNRLVLLANEVPIREPEEEMLCANALKRDLNLIPGTPETFQGAAAVTFARRLEDWDEGDVIGDDCADLLDD
ncbi:MAG: hypothetical protein ACI9MR_003358 [Myxococcota bacterium]